MIVGLVSRCLRQVRRDKVWACLDGTSLVWIVSTARALDASRMVFWHLVYRQQELVTSHSCLIRMLRRTGLEKGFRYGMAMALVCAKMIPYGHAASFSGGYKLVVMHCNVKQPSLRVHRLQN